jgi:hypothetical protein
VWQSRQAVNVAWSEPLARYRSLDATLICERDEFPADDFWVRDQGVGPITERFVRGQPDRAIPSGSRAHTEDSPSGGKRLNQSLNDNLVSLGIADYQQSARSLGRQTRHISDHRIWHKTIFVRQYPILLRPLCVSMRLPETATLGVDVDSVPASERYL